MKLALILTSLSALPVAGETYSFHHENVLGTSLELLVATDQERTAEQAERAVLAEIDRLSGILNTWSPDSEISRWQAAAGTPVSVSSDLLAVLQACDDWRQASQGAFNARVRVLSHLWADAARRQVLPDSQRLAEAVRELSAPAWRLDASAGQATFLAEAASVTVDALAKGYILDRAIEQAAAQAGIDGITLNIGGDLRVWGEAPQWISIADPAHDQENARPLAQVRLHHQALATSGGYRRGWDIAGRHYSHLFDPRTGQPVHHVASASVIAPDAVTADALATLFTVLPVEESLAFAEQRPGVSCLLVGEDGGIRTSSRWPLPEILPVAAEEAPEMELTVDFEINRPEASRYLRPYVAIWIENEEGFPVRTLSLWMLKGTKGLNWLPDLKRWHRSDKKRRVEEREEIASVISSATRNPGAYSVSWNGLDRHQKPVPPGEYTLLIEAAREKGTYQLIKHTFQVGGPAFKEELEGNLEIKSATLDYHKKAPVH